MSKFPKVDHLCPVCGGTGKEDVSRHGSPQWEECYRCKGIKGFIFQREMTVGEKLDYLLALIKENK